MLAASMQDRPFIPHSHVVFLGADGPTPLGMQVAFRKWDENKLVPLASRDKKPKTMTLNEALLALESPSLRT